MIREYKKYNGHTKKKEEKIDIQIISNYCLSEHNAKCRKHLNDLRFFFFCLFGAIDGQKPCGH